MDRSVQIKKINSSARGREIVISDIHANLQLYQKLLQKLRYIPNRDRLILLGDLIEKGNQNLEMVHFVMQQVKEEDVHCIMGNCDFIAKNVLFNYRLSFLRSVLASRKNSLIHEMADQLHISYETMPMDRYCQCLREHFLEELSFLNDLPHVIESEDRIYAHSAISSEENYGKDFKEVMAQPMFLKRNNSFHKTVVVGHMPVTEYCTTIASFDPIYDAKQNVWSIDGGNMVKEGGQLNALIFDHGRISTERIDDLPEKRVVNDVKPRIQIPFFINWNNGKIEILEKNETQCLVYSPYLHRTFWIDRFFIHENKGTDYTNYEIPLKKGDYVKIVCTYHDKIQVKKDGLLGWTYKKNID